MFAVLCLNSLISTTSVTYGLARSVRLVESSGLRSRIRAGEDPVRGRQRTLLAERSPGFVLQFPLVDIHPSARKHGIADADIEHAITHAMTIEDQDDTTRLYLGPARSAALVEVVTIIRDDGSELAIHAMAMRPKYRRLLPGG
jgi:hypothetical protein